MPRFRKNKIRKHWPAITILLVFIAVFLWLNFALAADLNVGLEYARKTGLGEENIVVMIAKIIRVVLGFLGIIAIILIIYAGFVWMTSQGNEEKITKAKNILKNAVIGLIIILSSFALVSFILNKLIGATTGTGGTPTPPGGGGGGLAALGSGIIEAHYPARNQREVPRNTKIAITFKEPMDISTLVTGGNINSNNVKIYVTSNGLAGPFVTNVTAGNTPDNKTFVYKPQQYLGSSAERIWYTVALTKDIRKGSGDLAFPGVVGQIGYDWSFEVGTFVDTSPPRIETIVPQPAASEPRNVVIQMNFNEAIDPMTASGATSQGFDKIVVTNLTDSQLVAGNFYISNQYRTVEFLTENACGINSCGNTVYCLPGGKNISTLAKAATLVAVGEPMAVFPYDGLVDMADNSLDGNKNGVAQGPQSQSTQPPFDENNPSAATQGDDYTWSFTTTNVIDLTAPVIISIVPDIAAFGVALDAGVEAKFNKLLMSASLNSSSITFTSNPVSLINYWLSKVDNFTDKQTTAVINHSQFNENTSYTPRISSGVKDIYQNCYSPCSGLGIFGSPSCCQGAPSTAGSCP